MEWDEVGELWDVLWPPVLLAAFVESVLDRAPLELKWAR